MTQAIQPQTKEQRIAARLRIAYGMQQGASNPRPIVTELSKAISDCYTDGIAPNEDDAVFLLLHQLTFVLTGYDIAIPYLHERWQKAMRAADPNAEARAEQNARIAASRAPASQSRTVTMACADEDFAEREFIPQGEPGEFKDGKVDYACAHCGWLQTSTAAGARELLTSATWHSDEARREFIEKAKRFGYTEESAA